MKQMDGIVDIKLVQQRWNNVFGLQSIIFALKTELISIQLASHGYLEEIAHTSRNKHAKIIQELNKLYNKQKRIASLLDDLYILTSQTSSYVKNIHPEELFDEVRIIQPRFRFSTTHTYQTSLVSVDKQIFCNTVAILLHVLNVSKKLSINYRKRGEHIVIRLQSQASSKLSEHKQQLIKNFSLQPRQQKRLNLDDLVIAYCLNLLEAIEVRVTTKCIDTQMSLFFSTPSARQLAVFEDTEITRERATSVG